MHLRRRTPAAAPAAAARSAAHRPADRRREQRARAGARRRGRRPVDPQRRRPRRAASRLKREAGRLAAVGVEDDGGAGGERRGVVQRRRVAVERDASGAERGAERSVGRDARPRAHARAARRREAERLPAARPERQRRRPQRSSGPTGERRAVARARDDEQPRALQQPPRRRLRRRDAHHQPEALQVAQHDHAVVGANEQQDVRGRRGRRRRTQRARLADDAATRAELDREPVRAARLEPVHARKLAADGATHREERRVRRDVDGVDGVLGEGRRGVGRRRPGEPGVLEADVGDGGRGESRHRSRARRRRARGHAVHSAVFTDGHTRGATSSSAQSRCDVWSSTPSPPRLHLDRARRRKREVLAQPPAPRALAEIHGGGRRRIRPASPHLRARRREA